MKSLIRPTLVLLALFTFITGILYPLAVTAAAQGLFPIPANGSLLQEKGKIVGSALIGQPFDAPEYFWGRPSATLGSPYDGAASTGSNLGPLNPALHAAVKARVEALRAADSNASSASVPIDLVTSSGSGLDPHISPAAALYQVPRVARARELQEERVRQLVLVHVEGRTLGVLGEPRVNVLQLNLALDELCQTAKSRSELP